MATNMQNRSIIIHSSYPYRCRIPTNEALSAMKDLTPSAYKLLIYYYSKSTGWKFSDQEIGDTLDVGERRVKELKRELSDKDYLLVLKGQGFENYFIGRQAVMAYKNPEGDN